MIQPTSSFVIGVDVGGTKIQIGTVSSAGTVLTTKRYKMDKRNQDLAVKTILTSLKDFINNSISFEKVVAIGIGLVGHIDCQQGVWVNAINIPITEPVKLAEIIQSRYGVPVFLDNDGNAATLAELKWGVGRYSKDFVFLNVGTGIAAGIVSNAALVRGTSNYAGEIGHMIVDTSGNNLCVCGQRGCFEKTSSGSGIRSTAKELLPYYPSSLLHKVDEKYGVVPSSIFNAADQGDELATLILNRAIRGLQIGITNIVNLLNPEYIVIGGGVLHEPKLLHMLSDYISLYALPVSKNALKDIKFSELEPDYVGMLGSAGLGWLYT